MRQEKATAGIDDSYNYSYSAVGAEMLKELTTPALRQGMMAVRNNHSVAELIGAKNAVS